MNAIEPAALWLVTIVGTWAAVAARVSFGDDPRLVRSGARALHAAAVLMLAAVATHLIGRRGGVLAASELAARVAAARDMLAAPDGLLLLATAFAAVAAAFVPRAVRNMQSRERRRAHERAGIIVAAAALATIVARAFWGDAAERTTPVELFDWSGMAFRTLYAAGIGMLAAPVAIAAAPGRAPLRLRVYASALATQLLALTLAAWSRYAAVAPATELDAAGLPLDPQWSTAYLLLLVPVIVTAAALVSLHGRTGDATRRSRPAAVLLLGAAAMIASAVAPAIRDWVVGQDVEFGMPLSPLHAWEASLALAVAVVYAGWLVLRAWRTPTAPARLLRIAAACAVATVGLAVLALATDARQLTLAPGTTAAFGSMGREWRFASQGTSQEEAATYDGALVAFEVRSGGESSIATAGERIYRDAHGHPAGRVAVPGLVRGMGGDVRFTVRALRGDEVLIRAQFHPLATVAWIVAALTVIALATFALLPQGSIE